MMIQLPRLHRLNSGLEVQLDIMQPSEQTAVHALLNEVVLAGRTYPQEFPLTDGEFAAYWMSHQAFVVKSNPQPNATPTLLGAFYLKPNFPGRCGHICNAGFIVAPEARGQGIGRFMGETMLEIAAAQGFKAVMFNLVFATNTPSLNLWRSLGFQTIGQIPQAARLKTPQGEEWVDAFMLYRPLP